jgi:lysophospholipase L1-like esterase
MPPAPGLTGNTLRQVAQVSIGGSRVRLRLSNEFGGHAVTVRATRLALAASGSAIDAQTDRAVTFGGTPGVTIDPGVEVVSDPLDFPLAAHARIAITLRIDSIGDAVTGHPGSRTTSWLAAGDRTTATALPDAVPVEHWYIVTGLDVLAGDAAAVVTLGNSITDGRGSGTNRQNRWPDNLARRLSAAAGGARVAVLNAGIGGNTVLRGGLGPTALERFGRDVLERPGVRWAIVLIGVNDIGGAAPGEGATVARELTGAFERMIADARARGIVVYGATILPFGGSFYDSPDHEAARRTVNEWIRTSGAFDAVIDMDAAVRDPANPTRLRPELDTGDHLHPNERGYEVMAEAVPLSLFERADSSTR